MQTLHVAGLLEMTDQGRVVGLVAGQGAVYDSPCGEVSIPSDAYDEMSEADRKWHERQWRKMIRFAQMYSVGEFHE